MIIYRMEYNIETGHSSREYSMEHDPNYEIFRDKNGGILSKVPDVKEENHRVIIWGFNEDLIKKSMVIIASRMLEKKLLEVKFYYD
jgi:hypothetical protein